MTGAGRIPPADQQSAAFQQLGEQGFILVSEDAGIALYRR